MKPPISTEQLVGYIAGELTGESRAAVEAALRCDHQLQQEFAEIHSLITSLKSSAGDQPPAALIERAVELWRDHKPMFTATSVRPGWQALQRARRIVAHLLFDTRQNVALPGFRGQDEMAQLAYASEEATIDLQLKAPASTDDRNQDWHVRGQIGHRSDPTPEAPEAGTVLLVLHDDAIEVKRSSPEPDQVVAQTQPDASGQFAMRAPPGRYELHVWLDDGTSIVVEDLRIG